MLRNQIIIIIIMKMIITMIICESLVTKCRNVKHNFLFALIALRSFNTFAIRRPTMQINSSNFVRDIRKYLMNNSMSNKSKSLCISISPVSCLEIKCFLDSAHFNFFDKYDMLFCRTSANDCSYLWFCF